MDKLSFKVLVGKKGFTPGISFPKEIREYMGVELGDFVEIIPIENKKITLGKINE